MAELTQAQRTKISNIRQAFHGSDAQQIPPSGLPPGEGMPQLFEMISHLILLDRVDADFLADPDVAINRLQMRAVTRLRAIADAIEVA